MILLWENAHANPLILNLNVCTFTTIVLEIMPIPYIGEVQSSKNNSKKPLDISRIPPQFFPSSNEWEKRSMNQTFTLGRLSSG